jgi:hypothetical protein
MAVALITSITSPRYDGANITVTVTFVISENGGRKIQTGAFSKDVTAAIGKLQTEFKTVISDAIVAQAREDGYAIEIYGLPLPVGRAILFPDMTWDVL